MRIELTHKVPQTFALPLGYAQHFRGAYWNRTNVKGFADLHLATRTTHLIVVSVGLEPTL